MNNKIYKIDFENTHGYIIGDIFWLNYYDINIFLYVCKVDINKVLVYELQTKKIKNEKNKYIEIIKPGLKIIKKSLLRDKNETKKFWVETKEDGLQVPIRYMCPIYKEIIDRGISLYPKFGIMKAVCLIEEKKNGIGNYYWETSNKIRKRNIDSNIYKIKNIA